jgi:hypothetical protein
MEGLDHESSDDGIEILDDFASFSEPKATVPKSTSSPLVASSTVQSLDTEVSPCHTCLEEIMQTVHCFLDDLNRRADRISASTAFAPTKGTSASPTASLVEANKTDLTLVGQEGNKREQN